MQSAVLSKVYPLLLLLTYCVYILSTQSASKHRHQFCVWHSSDSIFFCLVVLLLFVCLFVCFIFLGGCFVCLFVCCCCFLLLLLCWLRTKQRASVTLEQMYSDNCTCSHNETEVEDQTCCLTHS